ncbi:MAG: hypothetical protein AAF202_09805, partial [Pseudomonadota bacterium]
GLSSTELSRIPAGAFQDLTSLERIELSHLSLENADDLPVGLFEPMYSSLNTLEIINSGLTHLDPMVFAAKFEQLDYLFLHFNEIAEVTGQNLDLFAVINKRTILESNPLSKESRSLIRSRFSEERVGF